jgi:hypothetical protein
MERGWDIAVTRTDAHCVVRCSCKPATALAYVRLEDDHTVRLSVLMNRPLYAPGRHEKGATASPATWVLTAADAADTFKLAACRRCGPLALHVRQVVAVDPLPASITVTTPWQGTR